METQVVERDGTEHDIWPLPGPAEMWLRLDTFRLGMCQRTRAGTLNTHVCSRCKPTRRPTDPIHVVPTNQTAYRHRMVDACSTREKARKSMGWQGHCSPWAFPFLRSSRDPRPPRLGPLPPLVRRLAVLGCRRGRGRGARRRI